MSLTETFGDSINSLNIDKEDNINSTDLELIKNIFTKSPNNNVISKSESFGFYSSLNKQNIYRSILISLIAVLLFTPCFKNFINKYTQNQYVIYAIIFLATFISSLVILKVV
jgi:hypothetical protein